MKATHKGNCQICGREQKLPNGFLSKHGYKVDFGFFMGTCKGSGNLPFELTCELLQSEVDRAEDHIVLETKRIADFKAVDTKGMTKAMASIRLETFGRPHRTVEVSLREDTENHMVYADYEIFGEKKTKSLTANACYPHTVQGHVDAYRMDEVRGWERNIKNLEMWIREAKERVAGWKLEELEEV